MTLRIVTTDNRTTQITDDSGNILAEVQPYAGEWRVCFYVETKYRSAEATIDFVSHGSALLYAVSMFVPSIGMDPRA